LKKAGDDVGFSAANPTDALVLAESRVTLLIWFHQSHYRACKAYYNEYVCEQLRSGFPALVSYTRFVDFMPSALLPLCVYLCQQYGTCSGISFLD